MTGMNNTAPQSSRIVVVTGAGTGIGRATARAFAAESAHVVAIGRRNEPLKETAAGHDRIVPLPADITAEGEPERIVQAVLEAHGRLDVLVNNAGIVHSSALGTLVPELITDQLATNLVAPILLAQAALPFLETSGGVIVNVSTSVGQRAWPGSSVYAATKTALELRGCGGGVFGYGCGKCRTGCDRDSGRTSVTTAATAVRRILVMAARLERSVVADVPSVEDVLSPAGVTGHHLAGGHGPLGMVPWPGGFAAAGRFGSIPSADSREQLSLPVFEQGRQS
ncbi:SDR family oxidoreductase [Streptomyces sp. NPDC007095]|uniref:SDR family oxidoreductase n=1 Tax=Streptomyces sp. NPDC007095 TaxID=3154482 RepID=UPI0033CE7925